MQSDFHLEKNLQLPTLDSCNSSVPVQTWSASRCFQPLAITSSGVCLVALARREAFPHT